MANCYKFTIWGKLCHDNRGTAWSLKPKRWTTPSVSCWTWDSIESLVHGQQEGSAYNGHFESTCYHPLLLFSQHGDCLAAKLRPGNVHSAEDWDEMLLPEIERQQIEGKRVAFCADAALSSYHSVT